LTDLKQTVAELEQRLQASLAERDELLLQQAATAEILKVINSSPGSLMPVFDTILEKAHSLCDVTIGSLELFEGDFVRTVTARGFNERWEQWLRQGYRITDLARPIFQAVHHQHIADLQKLVERFPDEPNLRALFEIGGVRTFLALPLVKDGVPFGRIVAARAEVRPFTDKQIALLQSFADQAVIAMQNARLFNETKEALARQTATSDILRVISQSPTDVQPVFDSIVLTAARLFRRDMAFILGCDATTYCRR
jgi:GAF domain-containing protein